jgi:spermidine synthase
VQHHQGTIEVFDLGEDTSQVTYATECGPDAMALIIGGATGNALRELKRQLESPTSSKE